ncbi:uncharacterized protein LOC132551096 [Ylistrum balloti]|uniref:uncharacterized protein LOC132551096 n=1 Tax=Ylistrum balloti TaxID=509963 RepID=UPI002905E705|nr:uncharacterized protein LOC132551096 [Ylistrum balloti]
MAVMQREKVELRDVGETVSIPDHPVGKAMYYLKCICNVLDLTKGNSKLQKFTDFGNYRLLTDDDIDELTVLLLSLDHKNLIGKCLIPNEEACGDSSNKFIELESVRENMVIVDDILIAGQQRQVNRLMFFKIVWLQTYCLTPLEFLSERLDRRRAELARRNATRALPYPTPTYRSQASVQSYPISHRTSICCTIL